MVFLVSGRGADIEEKIKTDRRKALINDEKVE